MSTKYVTFEQAKWLKERGFDIECGAHFQLNFEEDGITQKIEVEKDNEHNHAFRLCLAPEQHQLVDWLLEKHGIWVYTFPVSPFIVDDENYPKIVWVLKICSLNQVNFEKFIDADNGLAINHHHSPREAYSAAFDYIKDNNMI